MLKARRLGNLLLRSCLPHCLAELLLRVPVRVHGRRDRRQRPIPLLLDFIDLAAEFFFGSFVPLTFFDEGAVVGFGLVVCGEGGRE
jgi:hypothetical protein